jgi:type I restriction enzyme, S subunit
VMGETKLKLPDMWEIVEIGSLCDLKNGRAFKPTDWTQDGLKIVRIQNLNNPDAHYNHFSGEVRDRFIINSGDLLFAWSGTPGTSFGAHIWRGERAVLNQHIFRVDFDGTIVAKKYFTYAINQKLNVLIQKAHGGVGLRHVTKGKFEETLIELPPLNEQRRIVAKIEELFSELDKGVESLKTARAQLKTYRQAVLKHAFEGKLTADWREENKDKLEPAEKLLERIKHERETRYQQQLEEWKQTVKKWENSGKAGKKPGKPRKQPELEANFSDFAELATLPDDWNWVLLNQLTEHIVDGTHKTPKYTNSGVYFISAKDVKYFRIDFSNTRFIDSEQHAELVKRCQPKRGNILITKSGTLGRVAVVETDTEFSLFESVANVPTLQPMNPKFLALACFHIIDTYFCIRKQKGVAVRHLHLEDLRRLPIPLPSPCEQVEVAGRLEAIFSTIENQETMIVSEITRAKALRQSILKKAFSGQLVSQDPNDEPASVLLERIRTEKTAQQTTTAKTKKKTKRKAAA